MKIPSPAMGERGSFVIFVVNNQPLCGRITYRSSVIFRTAEKSPARIRTK